MARKWSAQQEAIFQWFRRRNATTPHLVVRARAGTGKSTTVEEGAKQSPSKNTLICAFSKDIQLAMDLRFVDPTTKRRTHNHIKVQTLHSVGLGCVRLYKENIKIDFSSARADAITDAVCGARIPDAVKRLVTKLHTKGREIAITDAVFGSRIPDAVKRLVTKLHTKGREIAPHATRVGELAAIQITFECEPDDIWVKSGFDAAFVERMALEAMEWAANVKAGDTIDGSDMIFLPVRNGWLHGRYEEVIVDEAQDMTTAQLEIAMGVMLPGGRMCIVGDDRQAIFGFRGADSDSLDRLKAELGAEELGLTKTYRCGKVIVAYAQGLVPDYEADDNNPEGEIVTIHTTALVGMAGPGDYILSRVNAPLASTAMKLLKAGKRTRIAGKDIGKGLIALVRKFKANTVPDFLRKVESWAARETSRLETQLAAAVNGRRNSIKAKIEEVADKADMLATFAEGAKNVNEITDRIETLFSDDGLGKDGIITCSSVHRAKGQEANRVFVLRDTIRDYNIEEQNIHYVAVTRAKETLVWVSDSVDEE